MDGRKIFDAINTCDDVFIKEVVLDMENMHMEYSGIRSFRRNGSGRMWTGGN